MKAYQCNQSRFAALVSDDDNVRVPAIPSRGNVKKALERLNEEPMRLGAEYNHFILHDDAPCSIAPEKKVKKRRERDRVEKTPSKPVARPLMTNADFAHAEKGNRQFLWVCSILGIIPTPRQASKWRNRQGLAWNGQAEAARLNRKRIAKARLENAIKAWQKAMLCEVCLMDDQTQARVNAERACMAAEKYKDAMQIAFDSI